MRSKRYHMLTVATYITLIRIVLIVPILWLLATQQIVGAAFLMLVAGVSDIVDGYVARRFNQQSALGELLDPVADKMLILGVMTALWVKFIDIIPTGLIIFLWIKEVALLIGGVVMFLNSRKPLAARLSGKIAMILQVVYVLLLFFTRYTEIKYPFMLTCVMWFVGATALYALLDYLAIGYKMIRRFSLFVVILFSSYVGTQQESFIVEKKSTSNKTVRHLKEEVAVLLEELAHQITEQIQLLAQAQQKLLFRMREFADGDSKGCFSGASLKKLQQDVIEAQDMVDHAQKNLAHLIKLNNFLKGT